MPRWKYIFSFSVIFLVFHFMWIWFYIFSAYCTFYTFDHYIDLLLCWLRFKYEPSPLGRCAESFCSFYFCPSCNRRSVVIFISVCCFFSLIVVTTLFRLLMAMCSTLFSQICMLSRWTAMTIDRQPTRAISHMYYPYIYSGYTEFLSINCTFYWIW